MSLIIVGLVLLSCGCFLWWIGAIYIPAPKRDFTIEDLLLDESDLPPGWVVEERWKDGAEIGETPQPGFKIIGHGSGGEGAKEEVWVDIVMPEKVDGGERGSVSENIKRYSSSSGSHRQYIRLGDLYYFSNLPCSVCGVIEENPRQISFTSIAADESRLALEKFDERDVIVYWARYKEFLVLAHIRIERDSSAPLSFNEVEKVLQAIDRRMAKYLYPKGRK